MRHTLLLAAASIVLTPPAHASGKWVTYEGADGPGRGKTIVLVSGDEEYRSEEALPQLGKILAARHGFTCHVLFAIDPETGVIDPDVRTNIPGLDALADADLLIIATRFRDLPDEQMTHIDAYLNSGRPVIGLRTATHAFAFEGSDTYRRYSWNYDGPEYEQGFGRQVLGETWIAHHGRHGAQSTRGTAAPGAAGHPILRGIASGDIWGPTDVYRVRLPLPAGCRPIVLGQVLDGMNPGDPPAAGEQNDPMMPIAWTRLRHPSQGPGPSRAFTTTMGAATDLASAGTRRMLVNAVYWALGMTDDIPTDGADARLVGAYTPSDYGFGGARRGVRPSDHALGTERASGLRLTPGDRIVVVGNTFAERLAQSGVFDVVAHAAYPEYQLVIRHVPWSGDEVGLRPREMNVPTMEDWIEELDADVVVLCFGMNESFSSSPEVFERDLAALIDGLAGRRLVLISPIAHEYRGIPWDDMVDVGARNRSLAEITRVMRRVAEEREVAFVDLFEFSRAAYDRYDTAVTTNGIHPTEAGCAVFTGAIARQLGWMGDEPLAVTGERRRAVDAWRALACDKHYLFRLRYRPTNTEYVWGRRHEPFGVVNFPPEMAQLDRMIAAREAALWSIDVRPEEVVARAALARPQWPRTPTERSFREDAWTPATVEAKGTETSLGSVVIDDPETFLESFTVADGYVIECFASEQDFPELANPMAMTFDDRGRLWVLCSPTYPHLLPGERARDTLLILEDTDGDGRADRRTVFADDLYVPMGFAVDTDAVYVGAAPDLLRLVDLDGDDSADAREIVASGFGMPDSHHQLGAFEWDPAGGLIMHEGVFTKSNVETPTGPLRTRDAAVWRLDPRTQQLQVLSHCSFANPWGHAFDDYGASILADASGGDNYGFTHVSAPFVYPNKPGRPSRFLNRGRPTAGCEIVASRHFPDDAQDTFLVNQSIGFHGTRWNRLVAEGSGWAAPPMPRDLLGSSDVNFRPVAMEIGPDGALYIADWCNTIVGHMQYSVRDPRRDHTHGRIWRIRHATRPLLIPADVHGASMPELLELLRLPERNTRQHARRRLQTAPWRAVQDALAVWETTLAPADPLHDRLVLETLWIRHAHGRAGAADVEQVMRLPEPRARAGAVRVLRHLLQADAVDGPAAAAILERAVRDDDMGVRLEGVVTCGFLPDAMAPVALRIAADADQHDMDDAMRVVFAEVLSHLARSMADEAVPAVVERVRLERLPADKLVARPIDDVGAEVMLVRTDLPREDRERALTHLAGTDPSARATLLVEWIESSGRDDTVRALGGMLATMPDESLAAAEDSARALAAATSREKRALAAAVLMQRGRTDVVAGDAIALADGAALLDDGGMPEPVATLLMSAVEDGRVAPAPVVDELARHAGSAPAVRAWLVAQVDAVAGAGLDPWTAAHDRAMQALRALQTLETFDHGYQFEPVPDDELEAGRALYNDYNRGCVRCHGPRGEGLEGFPPLAGSPWVLGDPRRAASAVIHGLYGRVRMPDGHSFDAVMEAQGGVLDDDDLARILTYVRRSWGNFASAVTADDVAAARRAAPAGGSSWEASALLASYPLTDDTLVPRAPVPARPPGASSWFVALVRNVVVYLVPPFIAFGLIVLVLSRKSS